MCVYNRAILFVKVGTGPLEENKKAAKNRAKEKAPKYEGKNNIGYETFIFYTLILFKYTITLF